MSGLRSGIGDRFYSNIGNIVYNSGRESSLTPLIHADLCMATITESSSRQHARRSQSNHVGWQIIAILFAVLVCRVTMIIVARYVDYFPPNFDSEFLFGRKRYFFGSYGAAFYAHIITGPLTLLIGLMLMSRQLRTRFTKWHRRLGKIQVALVLFGVAPSGLIMARYAMTGTVAAVGFGVLAIGTGWCAAFGWQRAMRRDFRGHGRWMTRCFALLCSAVLLRVIGGIVLISDVDGTYPLAAWISWLVPLAVAEALIKFREI